MRANYELIIFDWDGTLIDSQANIVNCMQQSMQDLDLPILDEFAIKDVIGLGLKEALQKLMPDITDSGIVDMVDRYRIHFFASTPSEPFSGVANTLRLLCDKQYKLAVATGKGRNGLDKALHATGFKEYFLASRCADETCSKPDPQMIHEILNETKIDINNALMIGDTEYDLLMAKNAGMDAVAVSCGVHETERLIACEPLACLEGVCQLPLWLAGEKLAASS